MLSALKTYFRSVVSRIKRIGPVVVYWLVTKICILVITLCLCRPQRPRCLSRGSAASRLLGLRLRIPPRAWMFVVSVISKPQRWGGLGALVVSGEKKLLLCCVMSIFCIFGYDNVMYFWLWQYIVLSVMTICITFGYENVLYFWLCQYVVLLVMAMCCTFCYDNVLYVWLWQCTRTILWECVVFCGQPFTFPLSQNVLRWWMIGK